MVFGNKKKILPPFQPSSPSQPLEEEDEQQQEQKDGIKYFSVKAKSIIEKKILVDELAEPYVVISSRVNNLGEIAYVLNILARLKGYRVVSFSTTRFFAFVIVEKE